MADYNLDDKLQQWLDGALTPEEWDQVKQDAPNREELEQWEKIVDHSGHWSPEAEGKAQEEVWLNLEQAIEEEGKIVQMSWWQQPTLRWAAAAVIAVLVISTFVLPLMRQTSVSTPAGQHLSYYLPDSSLVVLNATSKISFPKRNWDQSRQVNLEGEAFFQVRKGSTFQVNTKHGQVTVLGTSFNVKDREGDFEVACTTGKVLVTVPGQPERVLTPGLATVLDNNELLPPESFDPETQAWQQGNFFYQAAPLQKVLDELERQFNIEITLKVAAGDRLYTGFFSLGNIEVALESVCGPMGLTYTQSGDKVTIE